MAAVQHPDLHRMTELDYNFPVLFGKTTHEYFGFTPFSQNSFNLEESYWLTLEHYMQAKKFCGHPTKIEEIKKMKKPEQIAHYTNDPENSRFINDAWNKNKMAYMYKSLYSKFAQNEIIHEQLMQTGNRYLIYATDDDRTWGIGIDRSGKNYLGLLLCLLRNYFLSHPKPLSPTPPSDCVYNFMQLPEHRLLGSMRPAEEMLTVSEVSTPPVASGIVYFGESSKPFYELSNDANYSINLDGRVWLTVTHYYQTNKFTGYPDLQNIISTLESPRQAREFAHSKKEYSARDFQLKKDTIMLRALTAKFTQHKNILSILLSTQSRRLVFDCNWDAYWGIGPDNKGLNRLGLLLSNIRASMQPGGALHKPSPFVPKVTPIRPTRHDDIFFFTEGKEYFEFTPYSQHRIFLDERFWPTVGHYFQAQKFLEKGEIFSQIEACNSAYRAWEIAHDPKNVLFIPTSFEGDRDDIMHKAINAKIEQHESVMNMLKGTGNRRLMFAAQDTHWGVGPDNNGNNKIGKILMEIRSRFSKKMSKDTHTKPSIRSSHALTPPSAHKPTPDIKEPNTIYFFKETDPLYPLTSFSNYSFVLFELKWSTLNHYFQAQKFKTHPDIQERIRQAINPLQALCIAQEKYEYIISNWKEERSNLMQLGLEVRFEQNPPLREMLMNTSKMNLVLNNKKDEFWGIGDGTGKNRYGKILTIIRDKYSASHKPYEQIQTIFPPIAPNNPPEHHIFNSEIPAYSRPLSTYFNAAEIKDKPTPLPRRTKPYTSISVHDTEWTLERLERPASYSVDKQNHVIIAKNANDEIIASICDTAIRFPMSVCDDEEHLYILCAPTLVKVNKFSGKKVNEICVHPGNAKVDMSADNLRVTDEIGEKEALYTMDLHEC